MGANHPQSADYCWVYHIKLDLNWKAPNSQEVIEDWILCRKSSRVACKVTVPVH